MVGFNSTGSINIGEECWAFFFFDGGAGAAIVIGAL